jgi:hypothetical protein
MATTPNKLSKIWQELKRRNVHRLMCVQSASSGFRIDQNEEMMM